MATVCDSEEKGTEELVKVELKEDQSGCCESEVRLTDSSMVSNDKCAAQCGKIASSVKCGMCTKLKMPDTFYCSEECKISDSRKHNIVHTDFLEMKRRENGQASFKIPKFRYTGDLRPFFVTPVRKVPDWIAKPDYAKTGIPHSELRVNRLSPHKIPVYTASEIEGIREACRFGRQVLDHAGSLVRPGITTEELDIAVHRLCMANGVYPSPLNYHNFPKSCCTSVNEVVCHGIPDCRLLRDGDIVNIDISVFKDGYHGDLNETYLVGDSVKQEYKNLIRASHDSMMAAIKHVKPGVMFRKFGEIIDDHCRKRGFSVVRTYCGHGIGSLFHTAPNVPHYKKNKAVGKCAPGMIFTIEPMINEGNFKDKLWTFDDWTSVTEDGKRSAQFEHTVLVTESGVEILTDRTADSVPFWWDTPEGRDYVEKYEADIAAAAKAGPVAAEPKATSASKKVAKGKKRKKRRG